MSATVWPGSRRLAAPVLCVAVLAACGTTVPLAQRGALQAAGGVNQPAASGDSASGSGATAGPVAGSATDSGLATAPAAGSVAAGAGSSVGTAATGPIDVPTPVSGAGTPGTGSGSTGRKTSGTTASQPRVSAVPSASRRSGSGSAKASGAPTAAAAHTTTPITIGIVYPDPGAQAAANAALGASVDATLNFKITVEAFVKQINATGGLDGRMIVPVEIAESSTAATAPDSDCQQLTQDDHVTLAIDALWGGGGDFATCMQKAGAEVIDVVSQTDAASLRATPGNVSLFRMNMDRSYGDVVSKLTASGYVTKQNKIGVLMDNCPNTTAAYNNTVLPLFKSLGLDRVDTVGVDCNGSTATQTGEISSSVLTFRTDNVDRVMIMSTSEQAGLLLFSEDAASQGYYPGYLLSSQAEASAVAPLIPAAARDGIHGVGNLPVFDVTAPKNPNSPIEAGCVSDMAKQGVTPSTSDDFYYVYEACAPFRLLASALAADGGVSTSPALASAIVGLGSFASPGIVGAAAILNAQRQDGPAQVQLFAYNDACTCTEYTTAPTAS